jgi:hypothetical protein
MKTMEVYKYMHKHSSLLFFQINHTSTFPIIDGTFRWVSELSDGQKQEQSGYIKPGPDPENSIQVIQGLSISKFIAFSH